MSYTNLGSTVSTAGPILRGASLAAMGRTVAIVVAAGLLAAVYQVASDESRNLLNTIRMRRRFLRSRDDALLMILLGSELDTHYQESLLRSRNAVKRAFRLLADPELLDTEKRLIRRAIHQACHTTQ